MSHFPIAVLHRKNQSIDLMLAPYDEYLEVEPYVFLTHEEAIEKAKKYKKEIEEDQYETLEHIKQMFFNANTDEELFQAYLEYCDRDLVDEDGNVLSTYNPDSKYDYYTEGGRSLFTKDGEEWGEARLGDVQFGIIQDWYDDAIEFWNSTIVGDKRTFYNKERFKEKYGSAEKYAKTVSTFTTYAVVTPDGVWHAPGNVGWFGMSSETEDEWNDWVSNYYERFFKDADPDLILTMVDCHI